MVEVVDLLAVVVEESIDPGQVRQGCPGRIEVLGAAYVHMGDLVVGDEDGVVAVRPDELQAVLPLALAQVKREADTLQSIADGSIDRAWVDQTLKSRGYA